MWFAMDDMPDQGACLHSLCLISNSDSRSSSPCACPGLTDALRELGVAVRNVEEVGMGSGAPPLRGFMLKVRHERAHIPCLLCH